MRISFKNKKLEKLRSRRREAVCMLGEDNAKMLKKRLEQIERAPHVFELTKGGPHQLKGDRAGQYAVSLVGGARLVFAPDQDPVPLNDGGGIDWSAVSSVRITFIGAYHG